MSGTYAQKKTPRLLSEPGRVLHRLGARGLRSRSAHEPWTGSVGNGRTDTPTRNLRDDEPHGLSPCDCVRIGFVSSQLVHGSVPAKVSELNSGSKTNRGGAACQARSSRSRAKSPALSLRATARTSGAGSRSVSSRATRLRTSSWAARVPG